MEDLQVTGPDPIFERDKIIALIAAARQQLPSGCLLDVRSASPAVRHILEIADWTGVRVST
jgi:hypothetical protein